MDFIPLKKTKAFPLSGKLANPHITYRNRSHKINNKVGNLQPKRINSGNFKEALR